MVNVNDRNSPRTLKWKLIHKSIQMIRRLNLSRSDLVMDIAHVERATPIHLAARQGN